MPTVLPRCPRCNALMIPSGNQLWCQFCGQTRDDPDAQQRLEQYRATRTDQDGYEPPTRTLLDDEQRHLLNEAWAWIQEGDFKAAQFLLRPAISHTANFADAWYLLSKTTTDPHERLLYLEQALAAQPYHEYAWREKGILEGVIPPGEGHLQDQPDPVDPVAATSETQNCPQCGGRLAYNAAVGLLVCQHCGFRPGQEARPAGITGGYQKLDNALLQRRFGFSKEWHIGKRVLVCQNCCAQITLSGSTLSARCPFCDTAHVLVQDAVGSFEEPDGLIPFRMDRKAAAQAIHERLDPAARELIASGDFTALYLPFWAFSLTTTTLEDFMPFTLGVKDVLVSGVIQPRQLVLTELMPYHLDDLIAYDHRYLATWPAQIYSVDAIQASITGWAYIKYAARRRTQGHVLPDIELARTDRPYNQGAQLGDLDRARIKNLLYRLLLLPVWMVTLHMSDDTRRPAVVNGQTGEVVVSASFAQLETIISRRDPVIRPLPRRKVIRPLPPKPG